METKNGRNGAVCPAVCNLTEAQDESIDKHILKAVGLHVIKTRIYRQRDTLHGHEWEDEVLCKIIPRLYLAEANLRRGTGE